MPTKTGEAEDPKAEKPKWRMTIRIERIDGKPLTKKDQVFLDSLLADVRKIKTPGVGIEIA